MFSPPLFASFLGLDIAFKAFWQTDPVGKILSLGLVGMSIYSIGVSINKFRQMKRIKKFHDEFLHHYDRQAHPAMLAIDPRQLICTTPVSHVYIAGANRLVALLESHGITKNDLHAWTKGTTRPALSNLEIDDIRSTCERELAKQQLTLEANMSRIAFAVSTGPSIGLFGTVWGVMGAFMSMSLGGSSMISQVAPGISGALLTTVVGLIVAIPAAFAYTVLSGMIRRYLVDIENFEDLIISDITRTHALPDGAPSTLQLNFQTPPTVTPAPAPAPQPEPQPAPAPTFL